MWTKNGKKILIKQLTDKFTNTSSSYSDFLFRGCTDIDVTLSYNQSVAGVPTTISKIIYDMTANPPENDTIYYWTWQLYLGTGTTPPTEDDIILENPVTFTCPVLPQISRGDNYTSLVITFTFTNNTSETKTITEIGLCSRLKNGSSDNPAVLFNRRLLDNPVTMNAGDSYVFSFKIDTSNLSE